MPDQITPARIVQINGAARRAGFDANGARVMTGIALAESRGVYQVNTSAAALCDQGGCPTGILQLKPGYWNYYGCSLQDDLCQMQNAFYGLNHGQTLRAWETYTAPVGANSYQDFLPQVDAALGLVPAAGDGSGAPSAASQGGAGSGGAPAITTTGFGIPNPLDVPGKIASGLGDAFAGLLCKVLPCPNLGDMAKALKGIFADIGTAIVDGLKRTGIFLAGLVAIGIGGLLLAGSEVRQVTQVATRAPAPEAEAAEAAA
jgi:hypothetical protein